MHVNVQSINYKLRKSSHRLVLTKMLSKVKQLQPFFFVSSIQTLCFSSHSLFAASSCVGISPLYHSECTERYGWVYMLYKEANSEIPQWGYVTAPHHCACKIQPKMIEPIKIDQIEKSNLHSFSQAILKVSLSFFLS